MIIEVRERLENAKAVQVSSTDKSTIRELLDIIEVSDPADTYVDALFSDLQNGKFAITIDEVLVEVKDHYWIIADNGSIWVLSNEQFEEIYERV